MSDELRDTTPLGKSVEEVEGEPQVPDAEGQSVFGRILNPQPADVRDTTDAPTSPVSSLAHALGLDDGQAERNPDADYDSSEES